MKPKRKDFSIVKWIIFPLNSLVLAGIVAYFNLTVFGYRDGLPYTLVVFLIGMFAILINKYTESENRKLARAAFVFEIFLTLALITNATYSISVQRKMAVAKMAGVAQTQTIEQIGKLRGSKTQREALKHLSETTSAQTVFSDNERILFLIMAGELALYGLASFTLFAIAKLIDRDDDQEEPAATPTSDMKHAAGRMIRAQDIVVEAEDFPPEIDVETRSPTRRGDLTIKDTAKTHASFDPNYLNAGAKRLREALRDISFHTPGRSFKIDIKPQAGYLWIRQMLANQGTQETVHSAKANLSILDDAVSMYADKFRYRLEDFLKKKGFDLSDTETSREVSE